jgi:hypothetical protein
MKNVWKFLLCLAVALPMVTYVAGALTAARQEPTRPQAIVLRPASASADPLPNPEARDSSRTLEVKPKPEVIERSAGDAEEVRSGSDRPDESDSPNSGNGSGNSPQEDKTDDDRPDKNDDSDSGGDKGDEKDDDSDKDDDDAEPNEGGGENDPDESESIRGDD